MKSLTHPVFKGDWKNIILLLPLTFLCLTGISQTTFWTESFSNGCGNGCAAGSYVGPNGGWTQTNTGANPPVSNMWYVSGAESDNNAGTGSCGTSAFEPSLHVGSTSLGDIGAAYDASRRTNKRIESPTVDCSTYTGLSITFIYMEFGEGALDDATLLYFDGSAWSTLLNLAKTPCCGGACNGFRQGRWTTFTSALPVSADGNANVAFGFNWTNDAASGSDPSFAVDDIQLRYTSVSLPIELVSFQGRAVDETVHLSWTTSTETDNDHFDLEHSVDGVKFFEFATVSGAGTSNSTLDYQAIDEQPFKGINYYRLKQTDLNGDYTYSDIIAVEANGIEETFEIESIYENGNQLEVTVYQPIPGIAQFNLTNLQGKILFQEQQFLETGYHELKFSMKPSATQICLFNASNGYIRKSSKVLLSNSD